MIFKLIAFGLIAVCVVISIVSGMVMSEKKYKNNPMRRIRILTRIRLCCFLVILILLFICIVI